VGPTYSVRKELHGSGADELLVAMLHREIAELRLRLEASEATALYLEGQTKDKMGRSPLRKLNRALSRRK
jgi:hypothetical protein